MSIPITRQLIECKCSDVGHLVVLERTEWEGEEPNLYLYLQLNHYLPFYKRVWNAIKYIFGTIDHQCHWSGTLITDESAKNLQTLLEKQIKHE